MRIKAMEQALHILERKEYKQEVPSTLLNLFPVAGQEVLEKHYVRRRADNVTPEEALRQTMNIMVRIYPDIRLLAEELEELV